MNEAERREEYSRFARTLNVFEARVTKTWILKSYEIFQRKFCQKFAYLKDCFAIFRTIIWNLWKGLPKGAAVKPEIIKNELIRWLGKEKVDGVIQSSCEEYEEFLQQVQDLVDALTKEYYSGFIGKILRKWDNRHQREKANKYKL